MSEQAGALWAMFFIGIPGVLVALGDPFVSRGVRIAGGVWIAVWWFPPLTLIWIKGVFG